jgi:pSer/pThr/pTyr-binding forkhead associated (FHA) protein
MQVRLYRHQLPTNAPHSAEFHASFRLQAPSGVAITSIELCFVEGPQAGLILQGQSGVMRVGRTRASKWQVKDPSVSEKHAEITWHSGRWHIRDLGSSNGTALNGSSVAGAPLLLRPAPIWLATVQQPSFNILAAIRMRR